MATVALNAAPLKADLYARVTTNNEQELSVGENVIGDILPAIWRYDTSSIATDDFTNGVIQPTGVVSGPGRWIRVFIIETSDDLANAISTLNTAIAGKFANPTGSNIQYIAGDGTLISFPFIPTKISDLTNDSTFVDSGDLATVATTGDYNDLISTPNLSAVATSGAYSDISGKPSLATVATSGAYSDLSGTPTIPTSLPPNGSASGDLTGTYPSPSISSNAITTSKVADGAITNIKIDTLAYSKLTGVPSALPPNGSASGDLTGSYPAPTIATSAVTTAKIADGNVTNAKIASGIAYSKLTGTPNTLTVYNAGGVVNQNIKVFSANITPSTASGNSTDISGAGFGTILSVNVTAQNNTSTVNSVPLAVIKTVSTSAVVINILSSITTSVLLGGNITGLGFISSLTGVTVNITIIGY